MHVTISRILRTWYLGAALGILAVTLAGCGGSSSSSSGPSSTSQTLKRLDVQIVRRTAEAPPQSVLARLADLLGWPQVAEASHCRVTAGGVSGTTGADEKASLPGVVVSPGGTVPVSIQCSDGTNGTFTLAGAVPGAVVTVTVEVEPGGVEVRLRDQRVSPPSKPSKPSKPSASESGSNRS